MAPAQPHRHETFQHKLEQFDPGMVWLDADNHVLAMNDTALTILGPAAEHSLGVDPDTLLGIDVLQMHPDKSRDKLRLLLQAGSAGGCPMKSPPPVAMMINIPDRVLVVKVSKMTGATGICGTCMIFYDLTDITTVAPGALPAHTEVAPRRLFKIPVYRKNRVILIDLKDIVRFQADGHYTTIVTRDDQYLSNLSLADLEARLDGSTYFRTHRSHIVSLANAVELVLGDDTVSVVMADRDNTVVPVSRPNTAQLKELLGMALLTPKTAAEKKTGPGLASVAAG
ncbi:LytTR family transcriptional regulator DNA-binding domain-containing protein [Actimicrobium antarcticum]|uniref:LytTR family transcriptional regulator DNA-binding domain-containing protein n=2 Tax=Actimicrobium antarcticum TaxID=1051899 RepID=A0ABP7T8P0_9BURK